MSRGAGSTVTSPHPLAGYLPAIYQEDVFARGLTEGLDEVLAPVLGALDNFDAYLDPRLTPEDFLSWLGGWLAVQADDGWPLSRRRDFLASATHLYRTRGTARGLVSCLETLTGGKVEVRTASFDWFSLNTTVRGLVIHGKEPQTTEPLLTVEQARIGLRIDSFWGRKVSLNDLVLISPRIHIRVEKDGTSNLPTLKRKSMSSEPLQETLLKLRIRHVEITDGWVLYNNVGKLVAVEGGDLHLSLQLAGSAEKPIYLGALDWQSVELGRRRDVPVPANVNAKFSLSQSGFTVEQSVIDVGRSHIDLQAETKDLASPLWNYRYRAWVDLLDVREIFRTPEVPLGRIDVRGEGRLNNGDIYGKGSFAADNVTLGFLDFHSANLTGRSSYVLDPKGVELPDFAAYALGGSVKGKITMRFDHLQFRGETKVQGVRLAAVTPAIDHAGFPIDSLHWDAVINADTVETWHDNFKDFDISAKMHWE